jgi:hypothetical protein
MKKVVPKLVEVRIDDNEHPKFNIKQKRLIRHEDIQNLCNVNYPEIFTNMGSFSFPCGDNNEFQEWKVYKCRNLNNYI